jgi:hypothetical protein
MLQFLYSLCVFVVWYLLNTGIISAFLLSRGKSQCLPVTCSWRYSKKSRITLMLNLSTVWGWVVNPTPRPLYSLENSF